MVDADLLDNGTRFPNLAQMKISAYCKSRGHHTRLVLSEDLDHLEKFDILIISKVFTYTTLPNEILKLIEEYRLEIKNLNNSISKTILEFEIEHDKKKSIVIGGTGFFTDGGNDLDAEIEHTKPDYELYNEYVQKQIENGQKKENFKNYTDFSIGFLTRGCFRKCRFCVNKKYDKAFLHSPVEEFLDESRPAICLLDDNFLSHGSWKEILYELSAVGKPFQFKQGLDIRLLNEEKAIELSRCRYKGDFIFAFDNISDKELITKKLDIWRKYCKKSTKLYVLCAYDPINSWDKKTDITPFELEDIISVFERVKILMQHECLPYVMRYEYYKNSQFRGIYTQLARWCNQPHIFKKMSFYEFCHANQKYHKNPNTLCAPLKALSNFEEKYSDVVSKHFHIKYGDYN